MNAPLPPPPDAYLPVDTSSPSPLDLVVARHVQASSGLDPVRATYAGIRQYDSLLRDTSVQGWQRAREHYTSLAVDVAALERSSMTRDEDIDADFIEGICAREELYANFEGHRRSPEIYAEAADSVLALFLSPDGSHDEKVAAACARLAAIPDALAPMRQLLTEESASAVLVRRELPGFEAQAQFLRDILPRMVPEEAREQISAAAAPAIAAFEHAATYLKELLPKARGDFRFGKERYATMLATVERLDKTPEQLVAMARAEVEELREEEARVQSELSCTTRQEYDDLLLNHRPQSVDEMLSSYRAATVRAQQFAYEHDMVAGEGGEECHVEPAPLAWRAVLSVACYISPPAFGSSRLGRFMVPFPPRGADQDHVEDLLRGNSFSAIPTTAVHEAYPGHHWQLMKALAARPLRKWEGSTYFIEGWALYAERMMARAGFHDPLGEAGYLSARLFRAIRIIVDTGLHCGEMEVEEAVALMVSDAGLPEAVARAEVARYCAWPTQASAYLTGAVAIEEMHNQWKASGRPNEEFFRRLGAAGSLPCGLMAKAVLHNDPV